MPGRERWKSSFRDFKIGRIVVGGPILRLVELLRYYFGTAWHQQYGNYSFTAGLFYANAQILFDAIEKAGTLDGQKIRQAVIGNVHDTVMGPIKYDDKGIALFNAPDFQWWNGKQELIFPTEHTKYKPK